MAEKSVVQKLTDWGCDTKGALERMLDDEAFYQDCLEMFCVDDCFHLLGQQLAAQDVKAAFDSAHTLKGTSANLGLTPILKTVCSIVEPLRAGTMEGTSSAYQTLLEEREALQKLIQK